MEGKEQVDVKVEIATVRSIVESNIAIPYYQRPYKWKMKHVLQLLDDVYLGMCERNDSYRIGSVILHNDNDILNVVDGQQRLVTLCLILHNISANTYGASKLKLLNSEFPNVVSKNNINFNYLGISGWLQKLSTDDRRAFAEYVLDRCGFVKIQIFKLKEAFQLFDSQNARGKSLEPYDLLKAFHLREMEHNTQAEKHACVTKWEEHINNGKLGDVIGSYLFRIRKWSVGDDPYQFTKEDIDEFKGVNLEKHKNYPYLKPYIMNDAVTSNMEANPINYCFSDRVDYPFQINQMIINGKRFFEYVGAYAALYDDIFSVRNSDFYTFYDRHVMYERSWRKGDSYVRKMYEALILLFHDRFGKKACEDNYRLLYCWSYSIRLNLRSVRLESIDKHVRSAGNPFKLINSKNQPILTAELGTFRIKPPVVNFPVQEIEEVFTP